MEEDQDLVLARKVVAEEQHPQFAEKFLLAGHYDDHTLVKRALVAIKAGRAASEEELNETRRALQFCGKIAAKTVEELEEAAKQVVRLQADKAKLLNGLTHYKCQCEKNCAEGSEICEHFAAARIIEEMK